MVSEGPRACTLEMCSSTTSKPRPGHRVVQRNAGMGVGTGVDHRTDEAAVSLRSGQLPVPTRPAHPHGSTAGSRVPSRAQRQYSGKRRPRRPA